MSIDYATTPYSRAYRQEPYALARVPVLSKALGYFLRTIVDPVHGWLRLSEPSIIQVLRNVTTGPIPRGDHRILTRAIEELADVDVAYLLRCTILEEPLGTFTTGDGRTVPLSPWFEDPAGNGLVIADWLPSEHGLTRDDTTAWHTLRRQRITRPAAVLDDGDPAPADQEVAS